MKRYTEFSYVQARLQARHGERPDAIEWKRLASAASLSRFLQTARKGPLRRWLLELNPDNSIHEIELTLRRRFREHVLEVADWMPADWRPAVAWTCHLPDLPILSHLIRGGPPPHWLGEGPDFKALATASREERRRELERSELAPLLEGADDDRPATLARAWYRHWRRLWPEVGTAADHLHNAAAVVAKVRARLGSDELPRSAPALEELERELERLFRRYHHEPAAAFVYLALTGLLVERLRGALAVRILFPPPAGEAA